MQKKKKKELKNKWINPEKKLEKKMKGKEGKEGRGGAKKKGAEPIGKGEGRGSERWRGNW